MTETATDQATESPWHVRLICCGRDDGHWDVATRGEAEVLRSQYTATAGHDRAAIITGVAGDGQQDVGAILSEYLEAMRADRGLRSALDECIALLAVLRTDLATLGRQAAAAEVAAPAPATVLQIDGTPADGQEIAFTCDGCLTVHWLTAQVTTTTTTQEGQQQ